MAEEGGVVAEGGEGPDQRIVKKFIEDGSIDPSSLSLASLSVLWYVEPDGTDNYVALMDGKVKTSQAVGDMTLLIHHWMHEDGQE